MNQFNDFIMAQFMFDAAVTIVILLLICLKKDI
jgi:hypothetical protein